MKIFISGVMLWAGFIRKGRAWFIAVCVYEMFKKRAEVFCWVRRVVLDPIKHVPRVFFFFFLQLPENACVNRVHNNYAIVNVGNWHTRKIPI